jgi:NAD(P)-dependent dehydrogenase (short-subunit alcohol dehydrogenase family)
VFKPGRRHAILEPLDGRVRHRLIGAGTVPVTLEWRNINCVAGVQLEDLASLTSEPAQARFDVQNLSLRMRVPSGPSTRRETDTKHRQVHRFGAGDQLENADLTGEIVDRSGFNLIARHDLALRSLTHAGVYSVSEVAHSIRHQKHGILERVNKKVLLVTGGSRGIGAAICLRAAQFGYDIAINYQGRRDDALETLRSVERLGARGIIVQADVSLEEDVTRLFQTVDSSLGTLTHLVNNAGVTGPRTRLDQVDAATLRRTLEINVLGAMLCAQQAVMRMSSIHGGTGGAMVNVSSAAATLGSPNDYVWYAASKAALESFTLGLAREVALEGIRVNAVAPGFIATEMSGPERLAAVVPTVPMKRAGTSDEVAAAVMFLLSEESAYTTGITLRVAGGR